MGWLVLFTVGATIGWLGAILARHEALRLALANIALCGSGSVVAGAIGHTGSLMASVSYGGVLAGGLGAIVVLLLTMLYRARVSA